MKKNSIFILVVFFIGCSGNIDFPLEKVNTEIWKDKTLMRINECFGDHNIFTSKYFSPIHVNYGDNIVFSSLKEDVENKLQRRKLLLKSISDSTIIFSTNQLYVIEFHNKSNSSFCILNQKNDEFLTYRYDQYYNEIEEFHYNLGKRKNTNESYDYLFNSVGWLILEKDTCNLSIGSILNSMRIVSCLKYQNDSIYLNIESILVDVSN